MPSAWNIYHVDSCVHTTPNKAKFTVIVCRDCYCMGFLINTTINSFVSKHPHLLKCQVNITVSEYPFLDHDSYIEVSFPTLDDSEIIYQSDDSAGAAVAITKLRLDITTLDGNKVTD